MARRVAKTTSGTATAVMEQAPVEIREEVRSGRVEAAKILTRSVCMLLTATTLGNSRKVILDHIELRREATAGEIAPEPEAPVEGADPADTQDPNKIKANKKRLKMSKTLLDTALLTKPIQIIESAKAYLRANAHAGHRVFGDGTYLAPLAIVKSVGDRLKQYREELRLAVEEVIEKYPGEVEKQRKELAELFNEKEYPTVDEVRASFKLKWSYVSFSAPDQLETVDRAAYEEAVSDQEERLASVYDEIAVSLRAAGFQIVRNLIARLEPVAEGGKKKAIFPTVLRDVREFVKTLPSRNLTDDDELAKVMSELAKAVDGIEVDDIRGSKVIREQVMKAAASASEKLEQMVSTGGRRAIMVGGMRPTEPTA
jgi:hypothetical protein